MGLALSRTVEVVCEVGRTTAADAVVAAFASEVWVDIFASGVGNFSSIFEVSVALATSLGSLSTTGDGAGFSTGATGIAGERGDGAGFWTGATGATGASGIAGTAFGPAGGSGAAFPIFAGLVPPFANDGNTNVATTTMTGNDLRYNMLKTETEDWKETVGNE